MSIENELLKALKEETAKRVQVMVEKPFGNDFAHIPYQVGLRQGAIQGLMLAVQIVERVLEEEDKKERE